jgi:hypothetical protein
MIKKHQNKSLKAEKKSNLEKWNKRSFFEILINKVL